MIRNNKRLYESIMRDVTKTVKRYLNENIEDDSNRFYDQTMKFYDSWPNLSRKIIERLISKGSITDGMDFDDAWFQIEEEFNKHLNKAVGGDWWEVGESVGLTDEQLDSIYNDEMQAKTDVFSDYLDEDGDYVDLSDYEEDYEEPLFQKIYRITPSQKYINLFNDFYKKFNAIRKQIKYPIGTDKYTKTYIDRYFFKDAVTIQYYDNNDKYSTTFCTWDLKKLDMPKLLEYIYENKQTNKEITFIVRLPETKCKNPELYQILKNYDVTNNLTITSDVEYIFDEILDAYTNFVDYLNQNL